MEFTDTGLIDERDDVALELVHGIISDTDRAGTGGIASLIGGQYPEAGAGQLGDDLFPHGRAFGKAVQRNDDRTVEGTLVDDVESQPVIGEGAQPAHRTASFSPAFRYRPVCRSCPYPSMNSPRRNTTLPPTAVATTVSSLRFTMRDRLSKNGAWASL
ncbi:Uncharacterised protein [Mycobacteroides abscessus subsp. abscessus]|nr:Uncharacterised protein [Mycobacteroides abscessus subsp. abscessus]